ncbi:FAD-dependent oxidoreductase [Nonomuraea sediminis]|uniref:FAD-dependent oxidoreductase n=1 Tax=Nonomuraea sediminis TaxID=2835864 RepID=UPI001BDBC884|nr:NAD(P)/FAD-dependent oxidoreductase [Nonomuraea sediminis]
MHVIVIGGGIGGLCLANGLKRAGVSVAVYERDVTPTNRNQGYRIHINTEGSRALHACLSPEIWERFVATAGDPGAGMAFMTHRLDQLALIEEDLFTGGRTAPEESHHAVSRVTLRNLLLADISEIVNFDRKFTGYETKDGRILARFADGSTATGDVLIGADGSNSRVRAQLLPDAGYLDSGALAVGGKLYLTPETKAWLPERIPAGMNVIFGRPGRSMFTAVFKRRTYDAGEGDYVLWALVARRDAYPDKRDDLRETVTQLIEGWHPALVRMVAESDPVSVEMFDFRTSAPVKPWPTGPVTLLGDAIHAMLPTGGEGGNTALRDAQLLTAKLAAVGRGQAELVTALGEYERAMIEYGFAASKRALSNARMGISASRINRAFARAFFRTCQAVPPLKRRVFGERWSSD